MSAAAVITVYAGGMRYTVAPLTMATLPSWFDPVKASITTAVTNATNWMDDLCPDATRAVPQSVVDFATTFSSASITLSNLETEILMSSGAATPEQRQRAETALQSLKTGVATADGGVSAIEARLLGLAKSLATDHDNLGAAAAIVNRNIPDGGATSKQINVELGDDFLTITANGPCMVSLAIKTDIEIKIKQTADTHTELVPYVLAQRLIANGISDNEQATSALSNFRAIWALMDGLVGDTANDLGEATDEHVLPVLQAAEFDAARDVWSHLASVAASLM